jgi:hypothetical protein
MWIDASYGDVDSVRRSIGVEEGIILGCDEYDYSMVVGTSELRERF